MASTVSHSRNLLKGIAIGAAVTAASLSGASTALAATASTTVTAPVSGGLQFINGSPGDVTFPGVTLNGSDQTVQQTQAFDVSDARGTAVGWAITATSTTFDAGGGHTLPTTATTITSAPSQACDAGSTCSAAVNGISYPYTLPAAAVAPAATKMYNATANSGMGNQTVTPTWNLTIPASAWAGGVGSPYTSTWTFTLSQTP